MSFSAARPVALALWACASALLCRAPAATAQVIDTYFAPVPRTIGGEGTDRSRAEALDRYQAPGVRVGSFLLRPDISQGVGYNTNAEGRPDGRGSAVSRTLGTMSATSGWSRNSAFVQVMADDRRYLDIPRQSYTDWNATVSGTLDVGHDSIAAGYTHLNVNQLPGSVDPVTFITPVPLRIDAARLSYAATQLGRFTVIPELRVTRYESDDFTAGAVTISQAYRNRVAIQPGMTARYQLAPQRDALLVVQGTRLSYRTGAPGLPRRDSDGVAVLGGLDYPAPGTNVRFRVLAGVQTRHYRSSVYASQTAPVVEGSAVWTPTRLTTVTLTARRDIADAADETIAGYVSTAVRLNVDHEARRNVLLNGYAELRQADFQQSKVATASTLVNEAGSAQTLYILGASATWLLNRNVRLSAGYTLNARDTTRLRGDYLSNTGLISLGFRL